jgi:DNA replication protein DnaC
MRVSADRDRAVRRMAITDFGASITITRPLRLHAAARRRSLKEAKLRFGQASVEAIDYPAKRGLDKATIRQLASCRWVKEHQAILITGMTGTGKSFVACALAHQACRNGFRALYRRAPRLFDELKLARADGSYQRVLARIARVDVLVLDNFAIAPIADAEKRDLLEVLEDRQETRSTIITSQLDPKHWHDSLSDPTLAEQHEATDRRQDSWLLVWY